MNNTFCNISCPFFTALLTDFHNSEPAPVLKSLEDNKPELILISGDLIYGDDPDETRLSIDKNPNSLTLLRHCAEIAPTFLSMGNHEWMLTAADLEIIRSTGTIVLDNTWVRYGDAVIGGLSSAFYTRYQALRAANPDGGPFPVPVIKLRYQNIQPDVQWLDDFEAQPGFRILLCHHPEYYEQYLGSRKFNLVLSGHAHGGQWRFYRPFSKKWQGVFAPGQGFFPQLTSGIFDNRLVISRGLSNTTFVPRINNPTEVIYLGKK